MGKETLPLRHAVASGDPAAQEQAVNAVGRDLRERGWPEEIVIDVLSLMWKAIKEGRFNPESSLVGFAVGIRKIEECKENDRRARLKLTREMKETQREAYLGSEAKNVRPTEAVLDPTNKKVAIPKLSEALPGIIENKVPEHHRQLARWKWLEDRKSIDIAEFLSDLTAKIIEFVKEKESFTVEAFRSEHTNFTCDEVELGLYRLVAKEDKADRHRVLVEQVQSGKLKFAPAKDHRWVRDTIDRANKRYIYPAAKRVLVPAAHETASRAYSRITKDGKKPK